MSDIRKEFSDVIYPTMVIRSQAETIELQKQEIERLNNIIDAKDYKIKRLVYSCYESDMSYGEFKAIWVNAFEKLYDPKDIDKLEKELQGVDKE